MTSNDDRQPSEPQPGAPASRPIDPGSVHVLFQEEATRVVLTGEIDAELASELLEAAASALEPSLPVEVDAQHVTFMDSTGVAFLARLASKSPTGRLTVLQPTDVVRFLLDVTDIARLVDIVDTRPR